MVIIIGSKGQVGWELCRAGERNGFDILPLDLPEFDMTSPDAVQSVIQEADASLVINAAAYTAVDQAESEPDLAFAVNHHGPALLAASCARARIPLIHMSTDYVYDGRKEDPYVEQDAIAPLNVYGESKAAGDKAVKETLKEHIILHVPFFRLKAAPKLSFGSISALNPRFKSSTYRRMPPA